MTYFVFRPPESSKVYSAEGILLGYFGPPSGGFNCYTCGTECECAYDFDNLYR